MLRQKELKTISEISEKERLVEFKTTEIQRRTRMLSRLIKETEAQIVEKKSQLSLHSINEVPICFERNIARFRKTIKKKPPHRALLRKIGRDVKEIIQALNNS